MGESSEKASGVEGGGGSVGVVKGILKQNLVSSGVDSTKKRSPFKDRAIVRDKTNPNPVLNSLFG